MFLVARAPLKPGKALPRSGPRCGGGRLPAMTGDAASAPHAPTNPGCAARRAGAGAPGLAPGGSGSRRPRLRPWPLPPARVGSSIPQLGWERSRSAALGGRPRPCVRRGPCFPPSPRWGPAAAMGPCSRPHGHGDGAGNQGRHCPFGHSAQTDLVVGWPEPPRSPQAVGHGWHVPATAAIEGQIPGSGSEQPGADFTADHPLPALAAVCGGAVRVGFFCGGVVCSARQGSSCVNWARGPSGSTPRATLPASRCPPTQSSRGARSASSERLRLSFTGDPGPTAAGPLALAQGV